MLTKVLRHSRGVTMVEYAVLLALMAAVCIGAVSALGSSVNKSFRTVAGCSGHGGGNGNQNGPGGFGCTHGNGNGNGESGKP